MLVKNKWQQSEKDEGELLLFVDKTNLKRKPWRLQQKVISKPVTQCSRVQNQHESNDG